MMCLLQSIVGSGYSLPRTVFNLPSTGYHPLGVYSPASSSTPPPPSFSALVLRSSDALGAFQRFYVYEPHPDSPQSHSAISECYSCQSSTHSYLLGRCWRGAGWLGVVFVVAAQRRRAGVGERGLGFGARLDWGEVSVMFSLGACRGASTDDGVGWLWPASSVWFFALESIVLG